MKPPRTEGTQDGRSWLDQPDKCNTMITSQPSAAQSILTHIAKAREAEKNVTKGPWISDEKWIEVHNERGPSRKIASCEGYQRENNASFIAAARADLPKCWEALEVLTKALEKQLHDSDTQDRVDKRYSTSGRTDDLNDALSKVNSILARP